MASPAPLSSAQTPTPARASTSDATAPLVKFQPLASSLEQPFWTELTRRKIEVYMLRTDPQPLTGFLVAGGGGVESKLFLGLDAFGGQAARPGCVSAPGTLVLTNTAEEFAALDKAALLAAEAARVHAAIHDGSAMSDPRQLLRFLVIAYGDLKKYVFRYLFAFPALHLDPPALVRDVVPLAVYADPRAVRAAHLALARGGAGGLLPVFLLAVNPAPGTLTPGSEATPLLVTWLDDWSPAWAAAVAASAADPAAPFAAVGFVDVCTHERNLGWGARNLLYLVRERLKLDALHLVAFRDARLADDATPLSRVFTLALPAAAAAADTAACGGDLAAGTQRASVAVGASAVAAAGNGGPHLGALRAHSGWERDRLDRVRSKVVDLGASLDPAALMAEASALNLKLMKWRLLPSLNLERVAATRVLLLGAGTLGCNVARVLMGWGIRDMTFVDSGTVSYSNPTRQSLFTFADAIGSATPKAECAAAAMRAIFPGMRTAGVKLAIPMPGHAVSEAELPAVRETIAKLISLYLEHDVVFLLTDTRESRWLPTLLGASMDKLVINTAMGFDSFLCMRHGSGADVPLPAGQSRLGCYFCADVVAARNSLADRSLDQQCTVTRAGLSFISSAMAGELLIALLHAPAGHHAPADAVPDLHAPTRERLGVIPHQLRFFLSHYHTAVIESAAYDCCTACSPRVVSHYRTHGVEFLVRAFADPSHLEDVSGLTAMKAAIDALEWADADGDAIGEDGSGDDF